MSENRTESRDLPSPRPALHAGQLAIRPRPWPDIVVAGERAAVSPDADDAAARVE